MRTTKEFSDALAQGMVAAAGSIRRMAVTLTGTATAAKLLWQMTGVRMLDGKLEVQNVEVFGGIGIAARPPASGKPEAIVVMVGGADAPVAIAVRDAKTQVQIAGTLKANETALYNSIATVHITDQGTIEARLANGGAVSLAKAAEVQALATDFYGHSHAGAGLPPVALYAPPDPPGPPLINPGQPGTTVLKGQ